MAAQKGRKKDDKVVDGDPVLAVSDQLETMKRNCLLFFFYNSFVSDMLTDNLICLYLFSDFRIYYHSLLCSF